ncbi:alpha/beta fold hydrolase [Nocardia cyriacigeorgica]|uniref:alpha/beta fold hydrolase n=1 Tax=Nocardia cyriacigeorgica TaxID=135487 RepID=UPI002457F153|nr:alpha/beta hydrolase [Nocardia cyriacigeorgica]
MIGMTAKTTHFMVRHDGVTIAVSRGGRGRPLVLCPGLLTTQADLHELTDLLRRDHDVVTFDLRGHGLSSAADRYSFAVFLGDFAAVMAEVRHLDLPSPPVLVGHSLGADLVVHYAREYPGSAAEMVLIDGANPVPEPFITEADLPEFRVMFDGLTTWTEGAKGTPRQVMLTAQEILDVNLEVDMVRSAILDQYRKINCPIRMIMSTSMAGDSGEGRAPWLNQNWQAGIDRLVRDQPHICTTWLDAGHGLLVTHAQEIARIIQDTQGPACQATS